MDDTIRSQEGVYVRKSNRYSDTGCGGMCSRWE